MAGPVRWMDEDIVELTVDAALERLTTDFAFQETKASLLVQHNGHRLLMIAEETGKCRRQRLFLLLISTGPSKCFDALLCMGWAANFARPLLLFGGFSLSLQETSGVSYRPHILWNRRTRLRRDR